MKRGAEVGQGVEEMRALRRLPRRAMVATSGVGVGVGVVVAVAVLVAGESGRHQTEHAAAAKGSLRRSVQFAFRRRSVKYVTVSAGGVATHVVSYRCVLAYFSFRRPAVSAHADNARIIRAINREDRAVTFRLSELVIDGRITRRFLAANVEDVEPTTWKRRFKVREISR